MNYVSLGRSGLQVSPVCIGGNSWGAAGNRTWAPFGKEESRPFFRRALDLGVNFFDTADVYNKGVSESILGECLLGYAKRDDVIIATKVGLPMGSGPNDRGLSAKRVIAGADNALKRLGTDHIDLFLLHAPDPKTPIEETLDALTQVVRAGKVRYVGTSNYPGWRLAQLVTLADAKGYARPIVMQNLWNLIQRETEIDVVPFCREQGLALTPYSPQARGILAGNRTRGSERAQNDKIAQGLDIRASDEEIIAAVARIAAARGVSPAQVALAWLRHAGAAAPVIGTTRLEQIDEAVASTAITLTADEAAALEGPYRYRAPAGPG